MSALILAASLSALILAPVHPYSAGIKLKLNSQTSALSFPLERFESNW